MSLDSAAWMTNSNGEQHAPTNMTSPPGVRGSMFRATGDFHSVTVRCGAVSFPPAPGRRLWWISRNLGGSHATSVDLSHATSVDLSHATSVDLSHATSRCKDEDFPLKDDGFVLKNGSFVSCSWVDGLSEHLFVLGNLSTRHLLGVNNSYANSDILDLGPVRFHSFSIVDCFVTVSILMTRCVLTHRTLRSSERPLRNSTPACG